MGTAQHRFVVGATLLSESAWLHAVFSVMVLGFERERSPLGYLAILAILASSFLVARGLNLVMMPALAAYLFQMLAGVIVLYLALATQVETPVQGLDLGWIGKLDMGSEPGGNRLTAALGGVLGAALWWRGGRLESTYDVLDDLRRSFRLGVIALAIAAMVDVGHPADLNVFPLMFLFFASSLAGLGIGHLLPASQRGLQARAWLRVIGGVLAVVLISGLLFSLLQRNILASLSGPVIVLMQGLATVVFFVIFVPIGFALDIFLRILAYILGGIPVFRNVSEAVRPGEPLTETLRQLEEEGGESFLSALLHALEWLIVAVVVIVFLYFLAMTIRRRLIRRRTDREGQRESVMEDADPAYDMAKLLFNLIPRRLRGLKRRPLFKLPDDDSDIVDVFRIYFGLLVLADKRGFPRPPTDTPTEYQSTLEQIFPQRLVRSVTSAFNRACYGHQPAPREQIEEMRSFLERLSAEAR